MSTHPENDPPEAAGPLESPQPVAERAQPAPEPGSRRVGLVGPSAAGKTRLALDLAEARGGRIVSMDSMLVYRGMDIGTAKPKPAELARVPHRGLDLVDPSERFDSSRWLAEARSAELDAASAGEPAPLFVGGTALYLRLLTHGLFEGPPVDPAVRAELERRWEAEGAAALHAELVRVDSAAAARLHPNDRKRVLRALEVQVQTGTSLSELQGQWARTEAARASAAGEGQSRWIGLAPEPVLLERRIVARVEAMLDEGWLDEVRRLEGAGWLGPTAIQALGYREAAELAAGRLTREAMVATVALRTRQFVRRQRTWFRRWPEIAWAPQELLERPDELLEWALRALDAEA